MNEAYRKEFKELAAENKQKMETSPNWTIDARQWRRLDASLP
ncbi:MAG: hypothetical protein R2792_02490 [Saprospiraceae bacterium]